MNRYLFNIVLAIILIISGCAEIPSSNTESEILPVEEVQSEEDIAAHIIKLETEALTNWSNADLVGYTVNFSDKASYIDNIMAADGVYGLDSIRAYMASLEEMELIGNHTFEIKEPMVQVFGNTAILTLKHHAVDSDGTPAPVWKASVVYENIDNDWKVVHANWSPYSCGE